MGKKSRNRRAEAVEPPHKGANRTRDAALPPRQRDPLPPASIGAIGVYLGILFGVGLLVLGVSGFVRSPPLPVPLIIALFLTGGLQVWTCWGALRRARPHWAFAVALSGTMTLAFLFGAPKIRDAMEVSIGVAMIPSVLALLVTCFLASAASDLSSR